MGSEKGGSGITYDATMTREQWRQCHIRAETTNPTHKSSLKWLSALASETFETAEVSMDAKSGKMTAKPWAEPKRGSDPVTLKLTRDAVQGLKFATIQAIVGTGGKPASLFERKSLLECLRDVGPAEVLLRMVKKEASLPDSPDLDEDDFSLEPEEEGDKRVE